MITGLYARRATGLTVAERDESFTWIKSVARWAREGQAAYTAKEKPFVFFLVLFGRCKVFQPGRKLLQERGQGILSLYIQDVVV